MIKNIPGLDAQSQAVLRLELAEELPAHEFSLVVQAVHYLYFGHLWLRLTEEAPPGQGPPDVYEPKPEETLYLERLEVGTPNFIEFIGLAADMWPTFVSLVGGIGGGAKLAASVYKDVAEARKAKAEARKVELEADQLEVDLLERSEHLAREGKINREIVEHKKELRDRSKEILRLFIPRYAKEPTLKFIERPRERKK